MSENPRRRLSDKICDAHAKALSEGRMDVADLLLQAIELELSAIGGQKSENREAMEELELAFTRHEEARAKLGH